ncbi:1-phosphofructokinase family hexose kinase [Chitinophaga caseinilytica]|uniref:1-phosphofructokinase family hexose kinase n=1 Tax=Chitinophaga caseinilytica TaxID=2267521 RepID=UPI003C30BA10
MYPIITVTLNPAVDVSTSVQSLQPEKKLRCAAPRTEPGGGGINVARVLHRFGEKVLPVYFAGGCNGGLLTAQLTSAGMAVAPVGMLAETRENLHVSDISNGRQYRFVMPGPSVSHAENIAMLNKLAEVMPGAQYVVVSGSLPKGMGPDFMEKLVALADIHDCLVIADLSGDGLRQATLAGVYLVKPNLGELAALADRKELNEHGAVEAAKRIIAAGGAAVVVISMGAAGAILVTGDLEERIPAPVVKPESTVGAGDSMVAGIVYGLMNGSDISAAARYGVACGTAATLAKGTGLCQKTDADRLFRQIVPGNGQS